MNEMYIISVLLLYTLIILIDTLLNTYHLLATTEVVDKKDFIYLRTSYANWVHSYVTPIILRINMKKDYLLNKKRRPPIILVAH